MKKIKMLTRAKDKATGKYHEADDIVDLGQARNEAAVRNGLAEWHEEKAEDKNDAPKKTTKATKKIETK